MNTTSSRTARAFTLIELLVVVAVTAILVAILLPVYTSAREKSRQATCTSNMRQIGTAMMMYAADNAQCLPPYDTDIRVPVVNGHQTKERLPTQGSELIASLYPYAHSKEVWYCPDDGPPDVARDGRLFIVIPATPTTNGGSHSIRDGFPQIWHGMATPAASWR